MNIFNNIKSLKNNDSVRRMEIYDKGRRIAIGAMMLNEDGRTILETYPKRDSNGVKYVTTQWNNKGKKLYKDSHLSGREVSRLVKNLTNGD